MALKKYARREDGNQVQDFQSIQSGTYDILAGGMKNVNVGPTLKILGALNVAVHVGKGNQLYVYNNTGAVHYVKFGDSAVAAPTSPADGIPIPANSYLLIGSGEDDYVRSDVATVFGYLMNDDTTLIVKSQE